MLKTPCIAALFSLFLLFTGCGKKHEFQDVQENLPEETNRKTVYYNSRKQALIQSITLNEQSDFCEVLINSTDGEKSYRGHLSGDDIVVRQNERRDLHMYRNGDFELRVYVVSREDSLPEDMEWTFYK